MDKSDIITLAADIVSAHVSANNVSPSELPQLIASVYAALDSLGQPAPVENEKREPAVSIRSSVKPETITCLECGSKMKMLKRHLATDHGLTPEGYRARWGLSSDYPMVAPEYAAKRRDLAVKIGLGRKPEQGRKGKREGVEATEAVQHSSKPEAVDAVETIKPKPRRKLKIAVADTTKEPTAE